MNAYCELFIYKDCKILKDKNFKVDDIGDYLLTLSTLNKKVSDVPIGIQGQFMKHSLRLTYNIELSQTNQDSVLADNHASQEVLDFRTAYNYNYLCAINHDERASTTFNYRKVYYYIVGKKWLSENSVQLELEMDVINTLLDNANSGRPLELSDKTTIIRQHKDRWKKGTSPEKRYFPVIDLYSEGISAPLFKIREKTCYALDDVGLDANSYYLIYLASAEGTDKPIEIYLASDEGMVVNQDWTYWNGTFNAQGELRTKYCAIIYGSDATGSLTNVGCSVTFRENTSPKQEVTFTISSANQAIIILNSFVIMGTIGSNGFVLTSGVRNMSLTDRRKINISGLASMRVCDRSVVSQSQISTIPTLTDSYILNLPVASEYAPSALGDTEVISINDVDRTQGRISKIVKLPFCPITITKNNDGTCKLPADWEVASWPYDYRYAIHYRYKNEPSCFVAEHFLESEDYDLTEPYNTIVQRTISVFGDVVSKSKEYETKLLHSDYFIQKFVYDSFAYNFRCEFMSDVDGAIGFRIKMATTSSMTSNFFFSFTEPLKIDNEDYSNLMMISRNNEVILYNSSYLDYIRNGYNFDKKTRNRNLALSIASLGLNAVSDVAGFVAGSGEKTKAQMIAGAVQLGAKTINASLKVIGQTAQADQNIDQRLRMSLYQGVSVAGSDELDLLSEYAVDNKPKMIVYKVSEKMEKSLFDLFYYTGYVANFQGVPDRTSRMWFNFVMAEPVYNYEQNFPQELIDALSERFAQGITFLHKVVLYIHEVETNNWDFEQQFENWETSILPRPRIETPFRDAFLLRNREYVIGTTNLSPIYCEASKSTKLTWRKRRRSDLVVIDELTQLDTFYETGSAIFINKSGMYVKSVTYEDYESADYYWTIEFSENVSTGNNIQGVYNSLLGYIDYI